jgi:hypothetical protein
MTAGVQTLARIERIADESRICRSGLKLGLRSQAADPHWFRDPPTEREILVAGRLRFRHSRPSRRAFEAVEAASRLTVYSMREAGPGISPGAVCIAAMRRGLAVMVLERGFGDLGIAAHVQPPSKSKEGDDNGTFPPGYRWALRHITRS